MAYGKDPKNLGTAGSFRQQANRYQQQRDSSRKRGGGGGGAYWATQYKPPVDDVDTIRVIEGHYKVQQVVGQGKEAALEIVELPFFPFAEHFDGREKKTAACSAGPYAGSKDKAQPCHGCDLFWSGMERDQNGKRTQGRMSRREMYVFTILDYGVYHHVEQIDYKTGGIRVNEQTNQPWMHWTKCEGQGCSACQAGKETRRGATRHWALGWGHYTTLLDTDKQIGKSCSNCHSINSIVSIAWTCPQCGDAFVDMTNTTMKAKEVDELVSKPVQCKCGFNGFAQEIIECRQCTPAGGTAKRATIFDVDMNVKRVQSANGGNQTSLQISNWSAPGPIDPHFKDFNKALDLATIYAPTPLEKQRELFQISGAPTQRTPVTSGEAARPWAQHQQQAPQTQPQPQQNPYQAPQPNPGFQQPAPQQQAPQGNPGQHHTPWAQAGVPGLGLPPPGGNKQ